ncbi:MAG: BatD family protein [Phycisphaerales bacterium]|nr:BatD family protein [Phycisphaerales bacterium]
MKHTIHRILFLFFISAWIAPLTASAQNEGVSIQAEIARERTYISEAIAYQITVNGGDPDTPPEIDFPDSVRGLYINGGQQSFTSIRIINGRQTTVANNSYTYRYSVTCLEPGVITIPPAIVRVDGKDYRSNPVQIESLLPTHATEDRIEVKLSRTTLYVNESVPLDVTWWVGNNNTSNFSFDSSVFPDSIQLTPVDPVSNGSRNYTVDIAGKQVVGALDQTTEGGIRKTRLRFRVMITPTEPGEFSLGPIRVIFDRVESNSRRYRAYAESDTINLAAISVPAEGKPAGYSGAIGSYTLESTASNSAVNIGDPIELVLKIRGNEPMQGIRTGPLIESDPAFASGFKVGSEGWREDLPRKPGQRVFRTTVRAIDADVTEIPAIKLPSFDPETGSYRVFASQPIPLRVRAVREVTIADAIGSIDPVKSDTATEPTHSANTPGVWAHGDLDSMLARDGFDLNKQARSAVWIGSIATGPMLALIALIGVRRRERLHPNTIALRRGWTRAKRLDRQGQHAEALRVYLGAATGCSDDAFSAADLESLELEEPLQDDLRTALRFDEQLGYAMDPPPSTAQTPKDLLDRLHRALSHRTQPMQARRPSA